MVLQLDRAEDLVAEPDRVDQHAADLRDRLIDTRVGDRVLHHRRDQVGHDLSPYRLEHRRWLAPIGPPERAAIRQRRRGFCYPVDPEVAPVEQPVRQPFDLGKGSLNCAFPDTVLSSWCTLFRSSAAIASSRIRLVRSPRPPRTSRTATQPAGAEQGAAATTMMVPISVSR